jgi:hypothetical protein
MSTPDNTVHDTLIRKLATDLAPVQVLPAPGLRAAAWLGAALALGVAGACFADLPALMQRLQAAPDMWLAVAGSTLTAAFAALAAFQLSLPDRSRWWALLPLPALFLWVAASGVGCLRTGLIPGTLPAGVSEERDCLLIVLGLSVPLAILLIVMLRRAFSLNPGLTAMMAGLASAAAAATLLNLFHPFDATVSDLAVHAAAVALVVAATRLTGARVIAAANRLAGV